MLLVLDGRGREPLPGAPPAQVREFKFLEEEPFETEYGVDGMVRQRQQEYKDTNTRLTTVGVVLCVLAAVPLFAVMCIDGADLLYVGAVCALLALVAVGCLALVTTGVYQGAMEQLLEEGDYTRPQKKHHKLRGTVTMIYWLGGHSRVPAVHLRPQRQRPAPVQLDHLGGGGRAVCRRYGHRSHHQPQPRAESRPNGALL